MDWLEQLIRTHLERDAGHSYLTAEGVDTDPDSPMNQLLGN